MKRTMAILIAAAMAASAQTGAVIRQGVSPTGAVDFSGASVTKPYRMGTTVPATCVSGEVFFKVNAGLYQCVNGYFAALGNGGTWGTIQGVISAQSDLWALLAIGGDVQRTAGQTNATVTGINGAAVPANVVLKSNASGQLVAATPGTDYPAPLGYTAENVANKGVANGYAGLDASAHVPAAQSAAITGDVTKAAGSSAATVTKINGAAVPTNVVLKSNASGQLVAATAGTDYPAALGYTAENVANKGAASGYASLDASAHVPTAQSAAVTGDVTKAAGSSAATVTALNGTSLAGLSTGLLTNTTGTGVPTITALPLSPANGGVGTMTSAPMWLRYFGDGNEGALNCSSTITAGEHWVSSFTVSSGNTCTITPSSGVGHLVIVRSTGACTIAGTLTDNMSLGMSGTNGFYGGGGGGGGGGTAAGGAGGASIQMNGGPLLSGGSAGSASGGAAGTGGAVSSLAAGVLQTLIGHDVPPTSMIGGAKGGTGGGNSGYAAGGPLMVLSCASINFTGAINASGGTGANSTGNNIGANGGGGGGAVVLATPVWTANTGTITVAGGAGGTCGAYTGCGTGGAGGVGWYKTLTIQ